jgi:ParB family chromosome partitioning protein
MDSFGHTQEKLAEALGKSRSHIANLMRLLTLPEDVRDLLRDGKLTAGHARALITADNPSDLAKEIVRGGLSVRATELLVKKQAARGGPDYSKAPKKNTEKDADTRALEGDLSANLAMKVSLAHAPGAESGTMTIRYQSLDELDTLCRLLSGN